MRGTPTARNGTHPRPVRVLTVDDQPLFRDAARAVISATPGFEALAEVGSGEDALALIDRLRPDVVLLDIGLPGIDGLETSRRLTATRPAPLVVLISADDDPMLRDSAREYGAAGFVSKKELRPGILRMLWDRFGGASAAITPPG
jgi:two-component system, NarL family, invasion response regulator UvrY